MQEYFRPNLFANTPDILHEFLQNGGLPAFRIRLILAATLGASYGIYSGFEIGENRPAAPGSEEYLDSEKYQFRHWPFDSPHNIKDLIRQVNTIRRTQPALQYNGTLRFHLTTERRADCVQQDVARTARTQRILMVVSLNPHAPREGWVCLALPDDPVADDETLHRARSADRSGLQMDAARGTSCASIPSCRPTSSTSSDPPSPRRGGHDDLRSRRRPIRTGTKTRSSTSCTSDRSSTPTTTASATFAG